MSEATSSDDTHTSAMESQLRGEKRMVTDINE